MLEVMGDAVNFEAALGRQSQEVHSGVDNTDLLPDVQDVTPLDDFLSRHRYCKALIPFSDMPVSCRKDFYNRAACYYIENGGGTVTFIFAAEEIARWFRIAIATCDRAKVHQSVRNRVLDKTKIMSIADVTVVATPNVTAVTEGISSSTKSNANRIGNCGRKRKEDFALPSNKLKKPTRGAGSWLQYQELCKTEATAASLLVRDQNYSHSRAGKSMQAALMENGVSLHVSTCREQVKRALANNCVGVDPQRNGGQALPSTVEKDIANMVQHLREQKFPVFPEDV